MKKLFTALIGWLFVPIILFAAPNFPVLTDRVVDTAGILTPDQTTALIAKLKAHEVATSNQIVVVTLKDLDGYDIADYGYQLGRHWQIGQKEKNNGALLIVSMNDRKVRIEVGYGLEGVLPDARAHEIVNTVIVPAFKQKKYYQGIDQAVDAIIASIAGEYKASSSPDTSFSASYLIFAFFFIGSILWSVISRTMDEENGVKRLLISLTSSSIVGVVSWIIIHLIYISLMLAVIVFLVTFFYDSKNKSSFDYGSSSWGSGSSSGSGFSGFGGSFGGGGASGSW